jgi:hypothetical protein
MVLSITLFILSILLITIFILCLFRLCCRKWGEHQRTLGYANLLKTSSAAADTTGGISTHTNATKSNISSVSSSSDHGLTDFVDSLIPSPQDTTQRIQESKPHSQ